MLTLIRTIASLTIALAAGAATAGENGAPAAPPSFAPSAAPSAPPAADAPIAQTPPASNPPAQGPATQAPAAQTPPQTIPAQNQGTPAVVLDTQDYEGLLGRNVRAQNGDDLGRVIDVITDRDGRPRAAIIDFGGFLGVGSRKIAVDWRALKFSTDGKTSRITLALNRNQVRVSPEYKSGEPIVVLGAGSPAAPPPEGEPAAAAQAPAQVPAQVPAAEKAPASEKAEKMPDR